MLATGAVAYFDILGYKAFMNNSSCDDAAALVVRTISGAEAAIVTYIEQNAKGEKGADVLLSNVRALTWVVFADTLLLLCPFQETMSPTDVRERWHALILSSQILSKHMFEEGLPLRGCISYGKFIQEENCFAGRTILDAIELAEDLPFAATVFHPNAFDKLLTDTEPFALKQDLVAKLILMASLVSCDIELNQGNQQLKALNFLVVTGIGRVPSAWLGNSTEIVMRSFQKHNKSLDARSLAKAQNTAIFFDFLNKQHPGTLGPTT